MTNGDPGATENAGVENAMPTMWVTFE